MNAKCDFLFVFYNIREQIQWISCAERCMIENAMIIAIFKPSTVLNIDFLFLTIRLIVKSCTNRDRRPTTKRRRKIGMSYVP